MISAARLDESAALHARVRAFVAAFERGHSPPEPFDRVARDILTFQAANVPGYARLCAARGIGVDALDDVKRAPAVPTDAFKLAAVFAFPPREAAVVFRTSGTTVGVRGSHALRDVGTYDAGALAFGHAMLAQGLEPPFPVVVIGPSAGEATDSSLAHMNTSFVRAWGLPAREEETYFVRRGELDVGGLRARVSALGKDRPVLVLATSFALVHLLDALGGERVRLPAGSRVMQTGGFKGKSRVVDAHELRVSVARTFDVEPRRIVGEYGMTELSSQFWEATAVDPGAPLGVYREPPWARVVAVDPDALSPVPEGEVGLARIEDLANVDSALAVQTQDRVRRVAGGFELLGRAPGATPRGCSIAIDEMLGGGA